MVWFLAGVMRFKVGFCIDKKYSLGWGNGWVSGLEEGGGFVGRGSGFVVF